MPPSEPTGPGAEVRLRLLQAAAELIPELGWNAVSTRVVARRAGVTPGVVHYHFASVQALLTQASLRVMRQVLSSLAPALSSAGSGDDALAGMLTALDDHDGADPTSLLFLEAYLAATRDADLRAELRRVLDEFRSGLAAWLDAQGAETPADTAAVLTAAVDGVLLHRALDPGLTSTAVTPVLRRLLHGPGTRTGRTEQR
ncbi:TetR/AcrR family transcriptional regulator [Blastococcus sp. SYSU DS0539]